MKYLDHGIPQVNGELADVDECVLVAELVVQKEHFGQRPPHEVDVGPRRRGRELDVPDVSHVHLLQDHLQEQVCVTILWKKLKRSWKCSLY